MGLDALKNIDFDRNKYWTFWLEGTERTTKRKVSAEGIPSLLDELKIQHHEFYNYLKENLLIQVGFADEFIRKMTELFGQDAIRKSILDTQNFMVNLEEAVKKAVAQIGGFHEVKKVEDIVEIMNYGVMSTPALVVDGVVKSAGKLLSIDEIINLLKGK